MKPICFADAARPWTTEEERYLARHRTDGADLLAHVLGRSVRAVRVKASRLGVSLAARPGEVCPMCGCYEIREHTEAARHGLCPVCWERRKAKAMEERRATRAAQQGYERAKKRAQSRG
jgi:hypothetical protein